MGRRSRSSTGTSVRRTSSSPTTRDGEALLDFGIAKAADATTVTESGVFKGKVRFSAPEQIVGTEVDRRSDGFAAGAIMWEMLTGEQMWAGVPGHEGPRRARVGADSRPPERVQRQRSPRRSDMRSAAARRSRSIATRGTRRRTRSATRSSTGLRDAPPAAEDLGKVMSTAFAKERQDMREASSTPRSRRCAKRRRTRCARGPSRSCTASSPSAPGRRPIGPTSGERAPGPRIRGRAARPGPPRGHRRGGGRGRCIFCVATARRSRWRLLETHAVAAVSASKSADHSIHLRISAQPARPRFTIDGPSRPRRTRTKPRRRQRRGPPRYRRHGRRLRVESYPGRASTATSSST